MKKTFSIALSLGAVLMMTAMASAPALGGGAFGVRAQSTKFLGSANAGSAAGSALSSMFWNPAAIGQFDGMNTESSYTPLAPRAEVRALPGSTLVDSPTYYNPSSGDIGDDAILTASYFSYQYSRKVVLGFSINAPFGLGTSFNEAWAGQTFSQKSKVESYNFSPTVAYRVSPGLILGASLQVQYARAKLRAAAPVPPPGGPGGGPGVTTKGDDIAAGLRLGALWQPTAGTSIGVGYRSAIDHKLDGSLRVPGVGENDLTAKLNLPQIATLSLRQALAPKWTLLGTVEWSNWSSLDKVDFNCKVRAAPLCERPSLTVDTLELGWHDSWYFSGGLEYDYSKQLTVRGGVGYGISPIQNPDERIPQLPDANRLWTGVGMSYALNATSKLDLAYAHVFIEDATINRTNNGITLIAETSAGQDIISIGLRTKWGGASKPVQPIK